MVCFKRPRDNYLCMWAWSGALSPDWNLQNWDDASSMCLLQTKFSLLVDWWFSTLSINTQLNSNILNQSGILWKKDLVLSSLSFFLTNPAQTSWWKQNWFASKVRSFIRWCTWFSYVGEVRACSAGIFSPVSCIKILSATWESVVDFLPLSKQIVLVEWRPMPFIFTIIWLLVNWNLLLNTHKIKCVPCLSKRR